MSDTRRVAVVGGGVAGLAAAWRLARAGAAVTVLEAAAEVGGRARTDEVDGVRVDAGAQLFGSMYRRALGLIDELGLAGELLRAPGRDALWKGGRAHEVVYGSVPSMLASGALPLGTKLRLGSTYVPFLTRHASSLELDHPERAAAAGLDAESIAAWGMREMGREFVEYLVRPQLASFYGAEPEETAAGFYHVLARHGMSVTVHALAGGVGTLATALAAEVERRGGTVRTGAMVDQVEASGDGVMVSGGWGEERFGGCVLAAPAPAAARLLAGPPELAQWLGGFAYNPAVTLALVTDAPLPVRWFGLSFPRDADAVASTVCVPASKGMRVAEDGRGVVVAYASPSAAPALLEAEARVVLDAMLPDLRRALPGVERGILRARVYRWRDGYPLLPPGSLARLEPGLAGRMEGGLRLALAGDFLRSPTLEGAVSSGLDAADRLLARGI